MLLLYSFILSASAGIYPVRPPARQRNTRSPTTPAPTEPSNDELCGCYQLDLVCSPIINNDEICYYYMIRRDSDENYCNPITTFALSIDNDCYLRPAYIQDLIVDYAPKCYDIDPLDADGIKYTLRSVPSPNRRSGFGRGYVPIGRTTSAPETVPDDYIVFSICFKASDVAGFNPNGQITYGRLSGGSYTCDTPDLPNFCSTPTPTNNPNTANPTTSSPTTGDPTTASPTTSDPTTADPTTDAPTTSNPTSAAPTTLQPTLAPNYPICNSTIPYNIAFLLDESGSVSFDEWTVLLNFVRRIINFDVPDNSYIALYEYASLPGFEKFLDWTGPKSSELTSIEQAMENNTYSVAGITETWDAVNRVLDDFYSYVSDPRNQGRENILFLMTDGNPTDTQGDPTSNAYASDEYNTCPYIEDRLERQFRNNYIDVMILVIDPDGTVDLSSIDCLDYFDGQADVITIDSFEASAFINIELRIREKLCRSGAMPREAGPGTSAWEYPDGNIGLGPVPPAPGGGRGCSNDPGSANPCP